MCCMQILSTALAQAEARDDEGALAAVLWEVAYNLLTGWEGPRFKISRFLDLVSRVSCMSHVKLAKWQ